MLNFESESAQHHWTTPETTFLVKKPQNSDCELFDFTVEANTGVGSTGPSQPSTAGFSSCKKNQLLNHCSYTPWQIPKLFLILFLIAREGNEPEVFVMSTNLTNVIDICIKVCICINK